MRDIGRELGTYATVTSLERTSSAGFTKSDSYTLEDIEAGHYKLLDLSDVLQDLEEVTLDIDMYKKVANGVKLVLDKTSEYLKFVYDQKPVALYKKEDDCYKMFIKF